MTHFETHLWEVESIELSEADPIALYLDDLKAKADRLRDTYLQSDSPEDALAWVRALHHFESESLECLGEDCPACDGSGEMEYGFTRATMFTPSEAIVSTCSLCDGKTVVLPSVAERFCSANDLD